MDLSLVYFGMICIVILILVVSKFLFDQQVQIEVLKSNLANATRRLDEINDEAVRTGMRVAEIVNEYQNLKNSEMAQNDELKVLKNLVENHKATQRKVVDIARDLHILQKTVEDDSCIKPKVAEISEQLRNLKPKLAEEMNNTKSKLDENTTELERLTTEDKNTKAKLGDVSDQLQNMTNTIDDEKRSKTRIEGQLQDLRKATEESKTTTTKVVEITGQLQKLERNITDERLQYPRGQPIAFSVWYRDLSTFDVVVFTMIILNKGDGYDSSTGYFTAPVRGVYSFSAQVAANCVGGKEVPFHIKCHYLVLSSSEIWHVKTYTCATVHAVCVLNSGDRVHVHLPKKMALSLKTHPCEILSPVS